MNYFLYGADTYRSRKKLHEIVAAYRAKLGPTADVHWVDVGARGIGALEEAGGAVSLFAAKKMIVAEHVIGPGIAPDALIGFLKHHKESREVMVVVWEGAIGEREKKIVADVKAYSDKTQEFDLLAGPRLARWIRDEAGRRGATLMPGDMERLALLGSDLWAAANEIEKIAVATDGAPAGAHASTDARATSSVFDLGDALFSSRAAALRHLLMLLGQGEDEMPVLAYLANYTRTLLILKISTELREPLPAALGIHPYVVKKTARLVGGLNRAGLIQTLQRFFAADVAVKTGDANVRDALFQMIF